MQKIRPFLWFDKEAEEAANLYVSIFKNSQVTEVMRYGAAGPGPAGSVMTVAFLRVMRAMLQMVKLDIATLQRAYNGE